jgi:oxygen-independent coproporphyrinogen-3 oxidase
MYKELALRKSEITEPIETIYFGGGTPSLLTESELVQFLEVIYSNYNITQNPEITLEANPDDLSVEKLKSLKKLNFNRLSIGIQSFHDEELKMMNRVHTGNEARMSVVNAQNVGFENITIDLIYGIPGSNDQKWQYNLDTFNSLGLPHLSSYALTVEKKNCT